MNDADETPAAEPAIQPLLAPRDGVPPIVDSPAALASTIEAFAAATGPVAVDAERASGYRYSQRAYLVQLRRAGAGTALIDPIACPDLTDLSTALGQAEWVFHAASQDLACLREVGLEPPSVFDTELAARLLGYPKVGLAAVVASTLGFGLAKEHSAADWSTRPLPPAWLTYAALDVELLLEVRNVLADQLAQTGKQQWAHEEFAAVLNAPPPKPKTDPWRRTSGIHALHDRRLLAVVREMWTVRDGLARTRDIAPGRLLPDSAIVEAATVLPTTRAALLELRPFNTPGRRRYAEAWVGAIKTALALPASELPSGRAKPDGGLPPQRIWPQRFPAAAARLVAAREAMAKLSEDTGTPSENLLPALTLRTVCFSPPGTLTSAAMSAALEEAGARPWQASLAASALATAFAGSAAEPDAG